jgi:hypothetical protein
MEKSAEERDGCRQSLNKTDEKVSRGLYTVEPYFYKDLNIASDVHSYLLSVGPTL